MGIVINASNFLDKNQAGLSKLIIYCFPYGDLEQKAIPINIALAEKLTKLRPTRRTIQLEKCFNQVILDFPENVVIKEFDVMFNPNYKVDILTLLIAAYKKRPFSIIWPGKYIEGKLIYAEEGCPDYKAYNIKDYDVICIV